MNITGRITLLWSRPAKGKGLAPKVDERSVHVARARITYNAKILVDEVERRAASRSEHDNRQLQLPLRKG